MSLISKSQAVFGALLLTTIGLPSVTAQTLTENPALTKTPSINSTPKSNDLEIKKGPTNKAEQTEVGLNEMAEPLTTAMVDAKTATTSGPQTVDPDKWQFQFSPYFWLAGLHGTGGIGNRTAQVDESFSDIFDSLNFAFMGTFEARKGKFISLTDLEYVSVSDEKATPGPLFSTVDAGFKTFIFDQEVGYRLLENSGKGASLDVLGGARVWRVKTDLEFGAGILPATRIEGSRSWVDAVGGLRGKMALSEKLFLTGKFDLGGGGSQFTWQVFGGGGYDINPKIALIFGYRVLDVDYDKNNFIFDMNQRGPILGIGFRF
ncbi:MAG TPA: hypothetical protein VLB68_16735 [Pyrinomonadaceae bacterium]|nr:hypothetical protein [Pyrinomonadaceae bacterium]